MSGWYPRMRVGGQRATRTTAGSQIRPPRRTAEGPSGPGWTVETGHRPGRARPRTRSSPPGLRAPGRWRPGPRPIGRAWRRGDPPSRVRGSASPVEPAHGGRRTPRGADRPGAARRPPARGPRRTARGRRSPSRWPGRPPRRSDAGRAARSRKRGALGDLEAIGRARAGVDADRRAREGDDAPGLDGEARPAQPGHERVRVTRRPADVEEAHGRHPGTIRVPAVGAHVPASAHPRNVLARMSK